MKIVYTLTIGALGCMAFAAVAQQQQQSPYQPPAVINPATPAPATSASLNPVILNLSGAIVTDESGQPLGMVQNIVLNPSSCVDLAVLSLGGEKLIPVPWRMVSGSGTVRGETELGGQSTFVIRGVDRNVLMQAPSVTQVSALIRPQTVQQVQAYFSQHQQQSAVGGTGSQTNVVGGSLTNRTGIGVTNQTSIGGTNQTGILSPTGPTNATPGRPAFETNRPPFGRPPTTRPPTNRPPATTPGQPLPNQPGQPLQ
jgi:hypothetical protein